LKGEGFLTGNISSFTQALESIVVTEDLCWAPGLLQGLDPRVKVITLVLFIILVGLAQSFQILILIFMFAFLCIILSKVPRILFIKRLFIFIPIFTAVIAIPALFITPGIPLLSLGGKAIITQQGAHTAGFLVMRVVDSLSLGLLLVLTTPWTKLLAALRWLRLPSLIVAVLSVTYRYIFLLLHTTNAMFLARRSRIIGGFSGNENRRWLAQALVTIMMKSQYMSEEVYLAMLSRGYQGDIYILSEFTMRRRDYLWVAFSIVAALTILGYTYL
jgi:cobalt/nickel transport system permease protein